MMSSMQVLVNMKQATRENTGLFSLPSDTDKHSQGGFFPFQIEAWSASALWCPWAHLVILSCWWPSKVGLTGQGQASVWLWEAGFACQGSEQLRDLRGNELDLGGQGLSGSHLRWAHSGVYPFIMISVIVKSILCVLLGITTIILVWFIWCITRTWPFVSSFWKFI